MKNKGLNRNEKIDSDFYTYRIYNASAGAGKTFILVKNIIKILLNTAEPRINHFLAITFTNKAANEMKERILSWLKEFSGSNFENNSILREISEEMGIEISILHKRAKKTFSYILHNYSQFNVSTIDKFNLRLMKSFAQELNISYSFSVELDASEYLKECIDELIDQLGTENDLSKILLDYIFWKFELEKNSDIRKDLFYTSKNFIKESNIEHLKDFEDKNLKDFEDLNKSIIRRISENQEEIDRRTENTLQLIRENELFDFPGKTLSILSFFERLSTKEYKKFNYTRLNINNHHKAYISGKSIHPEKIQQEISINYCKIQRLIRRLKIDYNVLNNLISIEIQSEINKFLEEKKQENDIFFLSDVNFMISNHIKNEAVPFIYEKLGNTFNHYFIDEFQDTSQLQWNNLIPLIEDTQATEGKSITLVGDPKQAIYRFRSGDPKIFMDLISDSQEKGIQVVNLSNNYRSSSNLVDFNFKYYNYISSYLSDSEYQYLFGKNAKQESVKQTGGRAQLSFVNKAIEDQDFMANRILTIVKECIDNGFSLKDIVILVRKNKEASSIAELLLKHHYKIITEEALSINVSEEVKTIIACFRWINSPKNNEYLFYMLYYLNKVKKIFDLDFSEKFEKLKDATVDEVLNELKEYSINIPVHLLNYLSFYNYCEEFIRELSFNKESDIYISAFLDVIYKLEKKENILLHDFLNYWDTKEKELSIIFPSSLNAIRIMSIHKSKGLEFEVVIYPIFDHRNQHLSYWFPLDEDLYNGFNKYYSYSGGKLIEGSDPKIDQLIKKSENEQKIDELCVQYVATTRAKQQLFIVQEKGYNETHLQEFVKVFYPNSGDIVELYPQADFKKIKTIDKAIKDEIIEEVIPLSSYSWKNKIQIHTEDYENSHILYGNIIHKLLAEIHTIEDISYALQKAIINGDLLYEDKEIIYKILMKTIKIPNLEIFFNKNNRVLIETELIYKGEILRPDRIVINDKNHTNHNEKSCSILDFKTGNINMKDIQQLKYYARAMTNLGYHIENAWIVHVNENPEIIDIFNPSQNLQLGLFS